MLIIMPVLLLYLKSNMDRFIEAKLDVIGNFDSHLKSNMDRFIDEYRRSDENHC